MSAFLFTVLKNKKEAHSPRQCAQSLRSSKQKTYINPDSLVFWSFYLRKVDQGDESQQIAVYFADIYYPLS